jgi:formate-dependent nitrite reductase cytochrome c552 subunit
VCWNSFEGDGKTVTYPWANGVRVEEIEAYYIGTGTVCS